MKLDVVFEKSERSFALGFDESKQSFKTDVGEVIDLTEGQKEIAYQDGYTEGHSEATAESDTVIDSIIENTCTRLVNDRVTKINQYLCNGNTKLVYIELPNVKSVGGRAFTGCSGLTEIDLPKCTSIGSYGFQACTKIASINLPELTSLGGYSFQSCSGLKSVVFPKLKSLGTADIYGCRNLHTIDLPACTSIGSSVMVNCAALKALILRANTMCTLASTGSFNGTPIASGTGYIYVPAVLVEQYKTAANWTTYAAQIRAIEDYPEITGG